MDESLRQQFVRTVQDFTGMTGIYLPDDVEKRLRELRDSETIENAKTMYDCMIEDLSLAKELHRPLCQDTGVLQYFVEVGTEFPYMIMIHRKDYKFKRGSCFRPSNGQVTMHLWQTSQPQGTGRKLIR